MFSLETVRRIIRRICPVNSSLYKIASIIVNFVSVTSSENLRTWMTLKRLRRSAPDSPVAVSFKHLMFPFYLRPGTQDVETAINNVVRREYGQFQPLSEPKWMIDAGAYIGDTAAFFLSRFPKLNVVALEPNPDSHQMASLNLQPYGERCILLRKGLWVNDRTVSFNGNSTGFAIHRGGDQTIECVSIHTILNQFSIPRVDILKMDIEGAEQEIFESKPETWLIYVDILIIEIHSSDTYKLVSGVLRQNNFCMRRFRSVYYCQHEIV